MAFSLSPISSTPISDLASITSFLVVQSCTHSQIGSSLNLTQNFTLGIGNVVHTQYSANSGLEPWLVINNSLISNYHIFPKLLLEYNLSIQTAASAYYDSSVGTFLQQQKINSIASIVHGQYTSPMSLAELYTLVISSSIHPTASSNLILTPAYIVYANGCVLQVNSSTQNLNQDHRLAVNNSTLAHLASRLSTIQDMKMVVQDSYLASFAKDLALNQAYLLSINSNNHTQSVANLALNQLYTLAIQGDLHTQAVNNIALLKDLQINSTLSGTFSTTPSLNVQYFLSIDGDLHGIHSDIISLILPFTNYHGNRTVLILRRGRR